MKTKNKDEEFGFSVFLGFLRLCEFWLSVGIVFVYILLLIWWIFRICRWHFWRNSELFEARPSFSNFQKWIDTDTKMRQQRRTFDTFGYKSMEEKVCELCKILKRHPTSHHSSCLSRLHIHIFPCIDLLTTNRTIDEIHCWVTWIFFYWDESLVRHTIFGCRWVRLSRRVLDWLGGFSLWPWHRTTREYYKYRDDDECGSHR